MNAKEGKEGNKKSEVKENTGRKSRIEEDTGNR
jgi:hypothetical protein